MAIKVKIGQTIELRFRHIDDGDCNEYHVCAAFRSPINHTLYVVLWMCGSTETLVIPWGEMLKAAKG